MTIVPNHDQKDGCWFQQFVRHLLKTAYIKVEKWKLKADKITYSIFWAILSNIVTYQSVYFGYIQVDDVRDRAEVVKPGFDVVLWNEENQSVVNWNNRFNFLVWCEKVFPEWRREHFADWHQEKIWGRQSFFMEHETNLTSKMKFKVIQ